MEYFVVAIRHKRRIKGDGTIQPACICADGVDPDLSRNQIIDLIRTGEIKLDEVAFIHHIILDGPTRNVTNELFEEAELRASSLSPADHQAAAFDHARELQNEVS